MHIDEYLTLDLSENKYLDFINIKQNENGVRAIYINLTFNGDPITLGSGVYPEAESFPIAGQTHAAYVNASVNGVITAYRQGCSISDDQVIVNVSSDLSQVAGMEYCELKIVNLSVTDQTITEKVAYSATFLLNVEQSVLNRNTTGYLPNSNLEIELKDIEARLERLESGKDIFAGIAVEHVLQDIVSGSVAGAATGGAGYIQL